MKTKIGLAALALLGWGLFFGQPLDKPERIVERTEYVDRIVSKIVERKTVKPDGTVTTTVTHSNENTKTHATASEKTTSKLSSYSLGLSVGRVADPTILTQPNKYQVDLGYRIGGPLWITTTLSSDRTVLVGARLDF